LLWVGRVHPLEHRFDVVDLVVDISCALGRRLALGVRVTLLLWIIERLSIIVIKFDWGVTCRLLRLLTRWEQLRLTLKMRLSHLLTADRLGWIVLTNGRLLLKLEE
jgi:hypothetical protein